MKIAQAVVDGRIDERDAFVVFCRYGFDELNSEPRSLRETARFLNKSYELVRLATARVEAALQAGQDRS